MSEIEQEKKSFEVPVLLLRDVVVYPHMVVPLFVGRKKSIAALEKAMSADRQILLLAQKNAGQDDPKEEELYRIGTIGNLLQMLKLPDGTVKVLVEGLRRAKVNQFVTLKDPDCLLAQIEPLEISTEAHKDTEMIVRSLLSRFEQYLEYNKKLPPEIVASLASIQDPERLVDTIAAHLALKLEVKQELLEIATTHLRLERLMSLLDNEIDLQEIQKRLRGRVKHQMEKKQREYYLNEQMEAIQKELGEMDEGAGNELREMEKRIENAGMTKEAKDKALAELKKLKAMPPMSAEATVSRNYLDVMLNVPWKNRSKISHDLAKAEEILEADHYGLEKIKERIIEYLAVQQRVRELKGPILCLVGPPGVGKTSLGQSIARATGRKYVRVSLGGVRDEAEIRGHRRTYIGSMPGKVLQKLCKVGVKNPLFMLDEIDKMSMDSMRGDPASALLEVLDPEQNSTFSDHYLEVDYDLSEVMFIATANSLDIPEPLLDRMEVIRLPGYTEDEKLHIALQYLVPKQMKANGLKEKELVLKDAAIRDMIRYYTREAGVRNLDRELAKVCRKVVREILSKKRESTITITPANLEKYLGVKKFRYGMAEEENRIGQVNGLAWTQVGGELLTIEAAALDGKGAMTYTGQLGDVMQESIKAALTVVRSRGAMLGLDPVFFEKHDFHIHVPEGATPKDGPSAGIGMCTAMVSAMTKVPVRADVAMTGEITLRGEILPIGGLKEKLLAAHRAQIKHVIIPEENKRDLKEVPKNILTGLEIHPMKWIDQVLGFALERALEPLKPKEELPDPALLKTKPAKHIGDLTKGKH